MQYHTKVQVDKGGMSPNYAAWGPGPYWRGVTLANILCQNGNYLEINTISMKA